MNDTLLKELINQLYDKPLGYEQRQFFIDRDNELKKLQEIIDFQPQGVYGVCGETGVGKTSFLKQFMSDKIKSYFIPISEKDNKEMIISDLIFKLATLASAEKDKTLKEKGTTLKKWVISETETSNNFSGGLNAIGSASISHSKSEHKRFNIFEAKERLDDLLNAMLKKHSKVLLIIDELDKEKKDEVMLILDSLKQVISQDNMITVISLPFSIYREYSKDIMRWNEWGNLENIFRNMFFLNPLTEQNVREMILKRMAQSPTALPNEAYYEIFRYSNGNPRDTLSITQEILLDNRGKEITKDAVTKTIKKAEDNHIKKTTAYTFIKRFLDNGFVKEENGKIVLSGRLYYYFL